MKKYHGAIAQHKKMKYLGGGMSRNAYYSKRSKLVYKIPYSNNEQSNNEERLFNSLPPLYKKVFPAVAFVDYRGSKVVIMKKVITLDELIPELAYCDEDFEDIKIILDIAERVGATKKSAYLFHRAIRNFSIKDLFEKNVGIDDEKNLVILDAGRAFSGM